MTLGALSELTDWPMQYVFVLSFCLLLFCLGWLAGK